jgi:hypothetical protein
MSSHFDWGKNPARKLFDILLATYWGYPLVMHQIYQYKSIGREAKAYLRTEIEKLPQCPLRALLLSILKTVRPPVGSFKIKSFKLKEDGDKLVHTHEIMADPYVFFRVTALAWLNMNSMEIFNNLNTHSITMMFKEKHIARFLYQYWNTGSQSGYSATDRIALERHVRTNENLVEYFKPMIDGVWSELSPLELIKTYDIPLKHEQLKALNNQTIQNGRLTLFQDSKGLKTSRGKHTSTKFLDSTLKMQSDLIDHEDREGNGSDSGDLLSFGSMGGNDE